MTEDARLSGLVLFGAMYLFLGIGMAFAVVAVLSVPSVAAGTAAIGAVTFGLLSMVTRSIYFWAKDPKRISS
jgi:hypothetical protein